MSYTNPNYIKIIKKYSLSKKFEYCLSSIVWNCQNRSFRRLCQFHFEQNGGIETQEIQAVFDLLELWIGVTDLLDDIEDGDEVKWGEEMSILVNASTAFMSIVTLELQQIDMPFKEKVIPLFHRYLLQATDGQHDDLRNDLQSEEDYIGMTCKKSGALMALSCVVGTVLATGTYTSKLEACAHYIAIVAQIKNDYVDLLGAQKDIHNKKRTLPILYLLQYNDPMFDALRAFYNGETEGVSTVGVTFDQINDSVLPIYITFMEERYRQRALSLLNELYPATEISQLKEYI